MKILFLALVSPLAIFATPDWSAFSHHAEITFPGYAGTTPLTNFPVLVRLADGVGGFSYAACCGENGGDVRFASVGGEELASSVVSWDAGGTSEFYVKVPEFVAGTKILVFWGNASAPAREALATPFDSDTYTLSWGFEEEGDVALDGTRQSRYGAGDNAPSVSADAVVGRARAFDAASSQWTKAPLSVSQEIKAVTNFTFEGWAKWTAAPSTAAIIFGNTGANWNRGTGFGLMTNGKLGVRDGDGTTHQSTEKNAPATDAWHHLMIARDPVAKVCTAYVDGETIWAITNKSAAWNQSHDYYFSVAHGVISGWTGYFTGSVDEVRAQSVCRNGDYAAAVYSNVVDYANFVTIANADGEAAPAAPSTVRQFPVTVAAGAGGSVSLPLAGALYDEGSVVEVTATPASDAYAFYAWEGDCPTLQVFSASLKLPVDRARSVTAIFGKAYHVSAEDGDDGTADGTSALPYASIEAAVSAVNADGIFPAVVLVDDGEYTLSYAAPTAKPSGYDGAMTGFAVALTNRVALRSVNGAASTGINCAKKSAYGAIVLTDPGAVVDGFAITNAYLNNWNYRGGWFYSNGGHVQNCFLGGSTFGDNCSCGVMLAKGWMQRCTIANVALSSGSSNYGGPLRSTGGLIDSCVFSNNTHRAGIRLGAAFVRNCLFAGNSNPDANSGRSGGAVYCEGQTVFENCTFMNNTAAGYGGAIYGDSVVVNCAFGGNSTAQAANGMDFYNKVRLAYSLSAYTTTVDGNVVGTPTVADAAAGDYAPTGVSATRNAGLATSWLYEPGRTDIAGNGRVNESLPDIGAFEYVSNGQEELAVMVSASAYTGTDTLAVNFSATVVGAGAGGVTYAWDFGDGTTSTAATPSHTYDAAGYYTVSLTVTDVDDNTRTASFDDGANLIKVMPSTCYVRAVGESTPVEPYATPGTAANDVYSAFLLSPAKIDIGEGDIPIGESFSVETALEIRGKGPDATRVNMSDKSITLSAVGATVADLTLRNSYRNNEWNVGMVNLCAAGTILTNCVVRDGRNPNAGLVRLTSSGKVVDCTITGGSAHCAGAGGIRIDKNCGARIERCFVTNNVASVNVGAGSLNIRGAGIWVLPDGIGSGGTPVIRNCLVARNLGVSTAASYRDHYGAGICAASAVIIENCTIVSNVIDRSDYATGLYVSTSSAFVTNTVFWGNFAGDAEGALRESDVGGVAGATFSHSLAPEFATAAASDWTLDACASGDPLFKDFDGGDYTFRGSSPLANAGARLGWMEDATDLAGNIRLLGKPDIGCFECAAGSGIVIFVR